MDAAQLVVKYKTQNICLFLVSPSTLWVMPLMGFHCSFGRSQAFNSCALLWHFTLFPRLIFAFAKIYVNTMVAVTQCSYLLRFQSAPFRVISNVLVHCNQATIAIMPH